MNYYELELDLPKLHTISFLKGIEGYQLVYSLHGYDGHGGYGGKLIMRSHLFIVIFYD